MSIVFKFRPIHSRMLCRSMAKSACPPQPKEPMPTTSVCEIHNGLRIVIDRTPSFLNALGFYIRAGPRHEDYCNNGVSHLISHLALKGNKSIPKPEIEKFCIKNNVRFDTHTYRDMLAFRAYFINPEHARESFDILSKVIKCYQYNKAAFEQEKYNLCVEAIDYEHDTRKVVFDYLHKAAFQCTSMGQTIIGSTANFKRFDEDMVCKFIRRQFQPNNIVIAGAGNFQEDDMKCWAVTAFRSYAEDCQPSVYGTRYVGSEIRYRDDSMPYVHVAVAVEAPGFNHEHYFPMLIAKNLLGSWHRSQGGGMNNRYTLAQASAVDDLCYYYEPFYLAYCDVGLWGVYYVCDKMAADDMLANVQSAFMRMVTLSTKHDITLGMTLARKEIFKNNSHVYGRVHDAAKSVMYSGMRKTVCDYGPACALLDKPTYFTEVVDHYVFDRDPVVAAVGPTEALSDMTRIRSGMYWSRY